MKIKPSLLIFFISLFTFLSCKKQEIAVVSQPIKLNSIPFENNEIKIVETKNSAPYLTKQIYFADENNGIAITSQGFIFTTTDKGSTWTKSYSSNSEVTFINDVKFIDNQTIIACGYIQTDVGILNGFIIKSKDWGNNWEIVQKMSKTDIRSLTISEDKILFAVASSYDSIQRTHILQSSNSGQNWENISSLQFQDGYSITSISKTRLTMRANSNFQYTNTRLISTDAGKTWSADAPATAFPANTISFRNNVGLGIQENEGNFSIFRTIDNGDNWVTQHTSERGILTRINVVSTKAGFAFGSGKSYASENLPTEYGFLSYTVDEGQTWTDLNFNTSRLDANAFYDESHGYFISNQVLYQIIIK